VWGPPWRPAATSSAELTLLPTIPPKIKNHDPGSETRVHVPLLGTVHSDVTFPGEGVQQKADKNARRPDGSDKGLLSRLGGAEFLVPETDKNTMKARPAPRKRRAEAWRRDAQGHHGPGEQRLKRRIFCSCVRGCPGAGRAARRGGICQPPSSECCRRIQELLFLGSGFGCCGAVRRARRFVPLSR